MFGYTEAVVYSARDSGQGPEYARDRVCPGPVYRSSGYALDPDKAGEEIVS